MEREGGEGEREDRMIGTKSLSTGVGATDLQFGACIFVPEAKSPVRPNSGQCTVGGVERNGIYLGGRRGEKEGRGGE